MTSTLKPLASQTIVITGATSGIGLATARAAAEKGASLVLVARSEPALKALAQELRALGSRAEAVAADVSDQAQVRHVAARAEAVFGGFDTWINNAAAAMYGLIEDVPIEDQRKLFETNYWGLVYGSLAAVEHFRTQESAGALINIGSVLSDQAIPIQGVYSAAKHAVKGFTNALRMELIKSDPQISVTLIKPSSIDTPYKSHARNYLDHPATNPPPAYDPAVVAEAILHACEHRVREITVGGGGRALALVGQLFPVVAEPLFAWVVPMLHRDGQANHPHDSDNLNEAGRDLTERTDTYPFVRRTSLYAQAQMNPRVTAAALVAVGAAIALGLKLRSELRLARVRSAVRTKERARAAARASRPPSPLQRGVQSVTAAGRKVFQ